MFKILYCPAAQLTGGGVRMGRVTGTPCQNGVQSWTGDTKSQRCLCTSVSWWGAESSSLLTWKMSVWLPRGQHEACCGNWKTNQRWGAFNAGQQFSYLKSFYYHHIRISQVRFLHMHFWGGLERTDSLNMAKLEKQLTGFCFALFLF